MDFLLYFPVISTSEVHATVTDPMNEYLGSVVPSTSYNMSNIVVQSPCSNHTFNNDQSIDFDMSGIKPFSASLLKCMYNLFMLITYIFALYYKYCLGCLAYFVINICAF